MLAAESVAVARSWVTALEGTVTVSPAPAKVAAVPVTSGTRAVAGAVDPHRRPRLGAARDLRLLSFEGGGGVVPEITGAGGRSEFSV